MRFQIASPRDYPSGLRLPWASPLVEWPAEVLVNVPRGISRNVVRFVSYNQYVYALKELPEAVATKEYHLLRQLQDAGLPVVEPISLVSERQRDGKPLHAILVTRFLEFALPFRTLVTGGFFELEQGRLLDALVDLLVRLHLAGFFWGDCSLSNTLFRRDAGRLAAYLVDAETGELHPSLSEGQRAYDLEQARTNIAGELMDLAAGFGLPEQMDPIEVAEELVQRYESLWNELTREDLFATEEQFHIEARIRRLNDLGFDVEELEIKTNATGRRLRMHVKVVEPGHHMRLLQSLTGLVVQENQARRLLNDIRRFRMCQTEGTPAATSEAVAAYRWYVEVYLPLLDSLPAEHRVKLDDAEIFHQILEHRWFISEQANKDIGLQEAAQLYLRDVLMPMPSISAQVGIDDDILE